MKYRPEIDGLRAIAVIIVILFHAGFESFSGGFVGVDVFFVISGYLITTIILTDIDEGQFSLTRFYERRVRRILPPLFFVMLISAIYAWYWLLPSDMKEFSQSLIAVSSFSSNFLFWKTSGYWETASELKPLLHTWSLAVEEQYYLIFPWFLILMQRFRKRWIFISFMGIAGISLVAAQWGAYHEPTASFYLLPTRLWELAVGAGISFLFLYKQQDIQHILSHKSINEIISLVGLVLIGYSAFFFDEGIPFPSLYTLVPTIGTGLIIFFSSPQTFTGRLLGSKPFVTIGLISYSAYLWHQPLFAFTRLRRIVEPDWFTYLFLSISSVLLAYLSWRFVENPFRERSRFSQKKIFSFALAGSLFFITIGIIGNTTNGFEYRLTDEQKQLMAFDNYEVDQIYKEGICQMGMEQSPKEFSEECFPVEVNNETIIIWGDSHAGALSYGFREIYPNMIQMTGSGCMPLVSFSTIHRPYCQDFNNFVLEEIKTNQPEAVILLANWSDPIDTIKPGLYQALLETINSIKQNSPNTNIFIIGGLPQWRPTLPKLLLRSHISLSDEAYVFASGHENVTRTDQILKQTAEESAVTFISITDMFCKADICLSSVKRDGIYEPFAWDYGHLTKSSSILVSQKVLEIVQGQ